MAPWELGRLQPLKDAARRPRHVRVGLLLSACRLIGFAILATEFFWAVTACKLDADPSNDCKGKCVLASSGVAVIILSMKRLCRRSLRLAFGWFQFALTPLFLVLFSHPVPLPCHSRRPGFKRTVSTAM